MTDTTQQSTGLTKSIQDTHASTVSSIFKTIFFNILFPILPALLLQIPNVTDPKTQAVLRKVDEILDQLIQPEGS